ncbi:MAG: hypothetical protein CUR34_14100 [Sediminibacterium sp.]|jgi:hypothetical protein|nr:MAG: hypothetical protein CUR34_14100 [Sediminibacterium sp.] [Sediminibacterium sp. FEMGT703S]
MNKVIFSTFFVLLSCLLNAQDTGGRLFLKDVNGVDLRTAAATIDNTEYLFHPNYLKARLFTKEGKLLSDVKYKLLLQDSRLFYLGSDGSDMEVISPIIRVEFDMPNGSVTVFEKGFQPIDNLTDNNFYQVLVEGKAKLLLDTKFVSETKQVYGTGAVTNTEKLLNYYGVVGNKIVKLTKPEDALKLMDDKYDAINEFLKKEKIKFKKQSELINLFNYFNQLNK